MNDEQVKAIINNIVSVFEKVLKGKAKEAKTEAKKIPVKVFKRSMFWTPIEETMIVTQMMIQFNNDFFVIADVSNGKIGNVEFKYNNETINLSTKKEENAMKWFINQVIFV